MTSLKGLIEGISALALTVGTIAALACAPARQASAPLGASGGVIVEPGPPNAGALVSADVARARSAGADELTMIAVDAGAPGDRISGTVSIPRDRCALILARGASSVHDLDLYAYGDDGAVIATDDAPDARPSALICPPHPARAFVVGRVVAGHGVVAVGVLLVRPSDADRVARELGVLRDTSERATGDEWPTLDRKVAEHRRALGGRWRDIRRVALRVDPAIATRLSIDVGRDRCTTVLLVPGDGVSHLDAAVVDGRGRGLGRAVARGRERAMVVCSAEQTSVTIEVRPHAGLGWVAVSVSESDGPAERDLPSPLIAVEATPSGNLDATVRKNTERLDGAGYGRAKTLGSGDLHAGKRSSMAVDLAEGCSRVDVLAGRPVAGVEAWLWSDGGDLIAHDAGAQATLFACGRKGAGRVDVEALHGAGAFAVEARSDPGAPLALLELPLASSRLLERMTQRGIVKMAKQVGGVARVDLEPTRLHSFEVLVPMDRCVDVTMALDRGSSGAEVRIVDTETTTELDLGTGTHAASARACAVGRPGSLTARADLRVAAGRGAALVATRMLSPKP